MRRRASREALPISNACYSAVDAIAWFKSFLSTSPVRAAIRVVYCKKCASPLLEHLTVDQNNPDYELIFHYLFLNVHNHHYKDCTFSEVSEQGEDIEELRRRMSGETAVFPQLNGLPNPDLGKIKDLPSVCAKSSGYAASRPKRKRRATLRLDEATSQAYWSTPKTAVEDEEVSTSTSSPIISPYRNWKSSIRRRKRQQKQQDEAERARDSSSSLSSLSPSPEPETSSPPLSPTCRDVCQSVQLHPLNLQHGHLRLNQLLKMVALTALLSTLTNALPPMSLFQISKKPNQKVQLSRC